MKLSLSSAFLGLVVGFLVLGQSAGLAGWPGEIGDRHFRKSQRGPGILTERLEKRKVAREASREKAHAAAEEGSAKVSNSAGKRETAKGNTEGEPLLVSMAKKRRDGRSIQGGARTVREARRGPGRGGKGSGPAKRRRVVLKPLFGN